ncbi:MAG: polymer-forming cytoskeletal protein [Thermoplasmata archaeon]
MAIATSGNPAPPVARGRSVEQRGVVRHDSIDAERWVVHGAAKVLRDAIVGPARLDGNVSIGGALRADRLEGEMQLEVAGNVTVRDTIALRGELRVGGTLSAGEATVRGILRVVGAVTVDRRLEILGSTRILSARAAEFRATGVVEIPGPVRAGAVDLHLKNGSRLGAIEARTVRIEAPVPNIFDSLVGRRTLVSVDRIEGETVEIAGIDVEFVHAREVTLGPGCHATTVEGTVVRRHPTARLGPESRSPAPHGLRR